VQTVDKKGSIAETFGRRTFAYAHIARLQAPSGGWAGRRKKPAYFFRSCRPFGIGGVRMGIGDRSSLPAGFVPCFTGKGGYSPGLAREGRVAVVV